MSEPVKECMDLEHCLRWLHLEPTHPARRLTASVRFSRGCIHCCLYRLERALERAFVAIVRPLRIVDVE
jgi:hypothetical protein